MLAVFPKIALAGQHFAFNWFDVALLLLVVFSLWRGRSRGMTKELFPALQWVAILLAAAFGHGVLGGILEHQGVIRQIFGNRFDQHTAALVTSYLLIAALVFSVFATLQRKLEPRLEGSNFFGGNEYYWGMPVGVTRYLSMVLVALALLNAPFYSSGERAAIRQDKLNTFAAGGHVKGMESDTGDFIPSIYEVQDNIFRGSLSGSLIKQYLPMLLINSVPMSPRTARL